MGVIEVLAGGAATGKTTELLKLYRAALRAARDAGQPGTTLWLSPTYESVRAIQGRLVDATLPAVFQPNVMRFDEFALKILERRPEPVVRLTPTMRRALLRRLVDQRLAERKLSHFAGIADTSGFLELLSGFITELKRAEIWPEKYLEVCQQTGIVSARDRELADLYAQYQNVLLKQNLYDAEGRFWFARREIAEGAWAPFETLSLVIVDGFTDFLYTQYEILEELARKAGRLIVSLPLEETDGRADLFAKPHDVLKRLQSRGEVRRIAAPCRQASPDLPAALRHVADYLFCNPRIEIPRVPPDGVEILPVSGAHGERQLLAARVKSLLLQGVSPCNVVVVLRSLADADILAEQFRDAGIPVACDSGLPLSRTPAMRALVTALRVESEDWAFEVLLALLDSNYFRPRWPDLDVPRAVREVASELRRLKIPFSREAILETLDREVQNALRLREESSTQSTTEALDPDSPPPPVRGQLALELLKRLDAAYAPLRQAHTIRAWARTIIGFSRELGLHPPDPAVNAVAEDPDLPIWDVFDGVLAELSRAERCLSHTDTTLHLDLFLMELHDLVRTVTIPTGSKGEGRVRILDAEHVRNVDVPYLFVAGLSEDSFPSRHGEDCVLHELERRRLRAEGLDLRNRDHHQQDEMLLFYNVVTRARRQLVLTYPAVDAGGHPLSPSTYLVALQSLFPGLKPQPQERLDPVPPAEHVLSEADLRVFAMDEALQHRPELMSALLRSEAPSERTPAALRLETEALDLSGLESYGLKTGEGLTRPRNWRLVSAIHGTLNAVDVAVSRFHSPGFTEFEGGLKSAPNLQAMARRFGDGHEFSVSQFERYVECPFKFLTAEIFNLQELATPDVKIDLAARGQKVHQLLAQLHKEYQAADQPPTGPEVGERFLELLKTMLPPSPRRSGVARALAIIEQRELSDLGREYGEQWDAYQKLYADTPQKPRPRLFEQAFGQPRTREPSDDSEAPPSLRIGTGDRAVKVGGFIDRVDVAESEGQSVFVVVDYKTGRAPKIHGEKLLESVRQGRSLQLVLYSLAVQKLGLAGPDAVPMTLGYWSLRAQGFAAVGGGKSWGKGLKPMSPEVWESLTAELQTMVPRLAEGMRRGEFPVYNRNEHCTQYCAFKTVCRISQVRALPATLVKVWEPPILESVSDEPASP